MAVVARPTPATSDVSVSWPAILPYFQGLRPSTYLVALPDHELAHVKNPKAGCSTIMVWLDRLHSGDHEAELRYVHKEHRLPRINEVGRDRVARMLSGAAYRFSFVRHPLRRFESVYWDKLVHSPQTQRFRLRILADLGLPGGSEATVTFEQFLSAVELQDPMRMNPHWRPQHINLLHPVVTYDHVGHLETFAADLERVREEARLPHVPWQPRNASSQPSNTSVYDGRPDLVRRVECIYAKDFELYGY